ncbi:MAG: hypothetical protein KDA75_13940 [Planctomycetaceae bacterium]|nr:hypothetical protein [Planctomycetaceae bacterium]
MQDRLLNAYLAGTVDEDVYKAKSNELKAETAKLDATLGQLGDVDPARGELAVTLFDWTQKAAEIWRGSNNAVRRQILDSVCLNRTVSDLSLCLEKRKPFDIFAERLVLKNSRDDRRLTFPSDSPGTRLLWRVLSQTREFSADTFFATGAKTAIV